MEEAVNDDPLIGATLGGRYRIDGLIGIGGMGRVYRATHTLLGKQFAIKVLPEARAKRSDATERFLREARTAANIDNEHIVEVVNVDEDEAHRLFIVMELLDGETLADRLERGPLPVEDALRIAVQIGDALQAAHDAGIVHRDLKPENVFLVDKEGNDFVKVLDFGISKIKNPEHGDPKLTATDQIVGTPLYISPELARGIAHVDHRTDIYALGVIVYEMLTGAPPFTGQNHFQLLYKHGNEAPDPPSQRSRKANIPPHVEAAVLRALEKNPDDRFETMRGLCASLEGPTMPQRARTVGLPLLAAFVFAAVAFVMWPKPEAETELAPGGTLEQPVPVPSPPGTSAPSPSPAAAVPTPSRAPATKKSESSAEPAGDVTSRERVSVALRSSPGGALVSLDGKTRGKTPLTVELSRGSAATVRFSLPGYRTVRRRIRAGEQDTVRVRLEKKTQPSPPPIKTEF